MNWEFAFAFVYLGGAMVAGWIQFIALTDREPETMLDLALIFLWPLMMIVTIPVVVWDELQKLKGTPND